MHRADPGRQRPARGRRDLWPDAGRRRRGGSQKNRHVRLTARAKKQRETLAPFTGGVLAYHPRRIELCGETIAEKSRRGYAWQILQQLRATNSHGRYVHLGSQLLASKLAPKPAQNTLIRAISSLRSRIPKIMETRSVNDAARRTSSVTTSRATT